MLSKSEFETKIFQMIQNSDHPDDIATRAAAKRLTNAFIDALQDAIVNDGGVQITGFGTFQVKQRAARMGRNVRTQEPVEIPARSIVTFKCGQGLKKAVHGDSDSE